MPQVVDADVLEAGLGADRAPAALQLLHRQRRERAAPPPLVGRPASSCAAWGESGTRCARPLLVRAAGLLQTPGAQVEVAPGGAQRLAAPGAAQQQELQHLAARSPRASSTPTSFSISSGDR